jgi:hypothetical protein
MQCTTLRASASVNCRLRWISCYRRSTLGRGLLLTAARLSVGSLSFSDIPMVKSLNRSFANLNIGLGSHLRSFLTAPFGLPELPAAPRKAGRPAHWPASQPLFGLAAHEAEFPSQHADAGDRQCRERPHTVGLVDAGPGGEHGWRSEWGRPTSRVGGSSRKRQTVPFPD